MNKTKRLLALVLALTMLCGLTVPAAAAGRSGTDILFEETDSSAVTAELPLRQLAQRVLEVAQCGCVIITLGAAGSIGMQGDRFWQIPPVEISCVDTSGAGDGFLSAMVANLVWGKAIEDACRWAGAYASYTTTKAGTLPSYPLLEEIQPFLKQLGL